MLNSTERSNKIKKSKKRNSARNQHQYTADCVTTNGAIPGIVRKHRLVFVRTQALRSKVFGEECLL